MQNSENIQIEENKDFLATQLITYIGNKRKIIGEIEKEIELISEKSGKECTAGQTAAAFLPDFFLILILDKVRGQNS